jgi:hypothetical protein
VSFPPKRESSLFSAFWTPALAEVTAYWSFSAPRYHVFMERKLNDPNDSKVDEFVNRFVSRFCLPIFVSSSRQIENPES